MDIKNTLTEYIRDEIVRNPKATIQEDEDLLSSGLIDSLGILKLVSFIEERLSVEIPAEDVVFENFHTIEAMSNYLASRE